MIDVNYLPRSGPLGAGYEVENEAGLRIVCLEYGASLQSLSIPDRHGNIDDIVLGFDSLKEYRIKSNQYFGSTIGRVANRIRRGRFNLNNSDYRLSLNDGQHHLHGGLKRSFDQVDWQSQSFRSGNQLCVEFQYLSPDHEEGYPGNLETKIRYLIGEGLSLRIEIEAQTDASCPVNISNHSYWNLKGAGNGSTENHELKILSDKITGNDNELIPTGSLIELKSNHPLNFSTAKPISEAMRQQRLDLKPQGIDQNFVLSASKNEQVRVFEPSSGRMLSMRSSLPCVQIYNGIHFEGHVGKGGKTYDAFSGLAIEPQKYPDAVNQANFPTIILNPGEIYSEKIDFNFSIVK